jgi:hypothetical protein
MTVKELIAALQGIDPDAEVVVIHETSHYVPKTVAEGITHVQRETLHWSDYTGSWVVPSEVDLEDEDPICRKKSAVVIGNF